MLYAWSGMVGCIHFSADRIYLGIFKERHGVEEEVRRRACSIDAPRSGVGVEILVGVLRATGKLADSRRL